MGSQYAMTAEDGFVFAATGERYRNLTRRTARTLRSVMPDARIDLFVDVPLEDAVFDQVHILEHQGKRPKMEALRKSRFHRTLYLDSDVVAVAEVSDVFALLHKADVVGVHEMYGASPVANHDSGNIPLSFRQINGGVIGLRKSPETDQLMRQWESELMHQEIKWDQPVLRRLLWNSDLKLAVLPSEYNLMHTRFIRAMGQRMCAPRLLHCTSLHEKECSSPETPVDLSEVLGPEARQALAALVKADVTLGGRGPLIDRISGSLRKSPKAHAAARGLWKRFKM